MKFSHWASVELLFITSSHTQYMKLHFLLEPAVFRHIHKIAKTIVSLLSHRLSAWNNSAPLRQIFIEFYIGYFSKMCLEDASFIKIYQEYRVLLLEDQYTVLIISVSFLLIMRNVSDKSCRDSKHTLCVP